MLANHDDSNLNSSLVEECNERDFDIKVESNALASEQEIDIKVESNAMTSEQQLMEYKEDESCKDMNSENFSIAQGVLQGSNDVDATIQNMTFSSSDLAQFPIHQLPLSATDLQSLTEINRNVLMSAAALPEDTKSEEGVNIIIEQNDQKMLLMKQINEYQAGMVNNAGLEMSDNKSVTLQDDGKEYLVAEFNPDINGSLFIKPEMTTTGSGARDAMLAPGKDSLNVKSEQTPVAPKVAISVSTTNASSQQQLFCVQVSPNGTHNQLFIAPSSQLIKQPGQQLILPALHKQPVINEALLKPKRKVTRRSRAAKTTDDKVQILAPRYFVPVSSANMLASTTVSANQTIGNAPIMSLAPTLKPNPVIPEPPVEGGHYFEVLGRCMQCFRFSRTTAYCRAEKRHREPKAAPCAECEEAWRSTAVCRRKLNHKAPNSQPINMVINTALQRSPEIKELCTRNMLPECFGELQSIVVHHADIAFATGKVNTKDDTSENEYGTIDMNNTGGMTCRKPNEYARGYLHPFSKQAWEEWLVKFCVQTGTNYRVRTGKRVNKKSDHGLANHNGKVVVYRTIETQLYNCALGGKPRKRKLKDGAKKRKERGSKLVGCPAVIHTRLIETENHWTALEVTVPKLSSHLSCHDPRDVQNDVALDLNDIQLLQQQMANGGRMSVQSMSSTNESRFDLIDVIEGQSNQMSSNDDAAAAAMEAKKLAEATALLNGPLRKQTRSLFINCADILNTINNTELLKAIYDHVQGLYSQLLKASLASIATASPPNKRARTAKQSGQVQDEQDLNLDRVNLLTDVS